MYYDNVCLLIIIYLPHSLLGVFVIKFSMFGRGLSFFTTAVSSEDEDTESDSSQVLYHSDNLNDNNLNSKLCDLILYSDFFY